jgi:hypothetical protein
MVCRSCPWVRREPYLNIFDYSCSSPFGLACYSDLCVDFGCQWHAMFTDNTFIWMFRFKGKLQFLCCFVNRTVARHRWVQQLWAPICGAHMGPYIWPHVWAQYGPKHWPNLDSKWAQHIPNIWAQNGPNKPAKEYWPRGIRKPCWGIIDRFGARRSARSMVQTELKITIKQNDQHENANIQIEVYGADQWPH